MEVPLSANVSEVGRIKRSLKRGDRSTVTSSGRFNIRDTDGGLVISSRERKRLITLREGKDFNTVVAQNGSGGDLGAFQPVYLDSPYYASGNDSFRYRGTPVVKNTWTVTNSAVQLGITLQAIGSGGFGKVAVSGLIPSQISIGNANHDRLFTNSKTNPSLLKTTFNCGWAFLPVGGNVGPTGTQWALVNLSNYVAPNTMFPVVVLMDGGYPGTASTAATWKYRAKWSPDGSAEYTIGTTINPDFTRPHGKIVQGTSGMGHYALETGTWPTFHLRWVDEYYEVC